MISFDSCSFQASLSFSESFSLAQKMRPSWAGSVSLSLPLPVLLMTLIFNLSFGLLSGKYYAVEDMLTEDAAEKYGTTTLRQHYERIKVEGQEYDPYTTMLATKKT